MCILSINNRRKSSSFFYQLKLKSIPKIKFACSISTDHYKNKYNYRKKIIEISLIVKIGIYANIDGNKIYCPPNSLLVALPDLNCTFYTAQNGNIRIESVAIEIEEFDFNRVNIEDFDNNISEDINKVIFPFNLQVNDDYMRISKRFKMLIDNYLKHNVTANYICIAIWFKMVAHINSKYKNSYTKIMMM